MSDYFTLMNREAVPCDAETWAQLMNNVDVRRVAQSHIGETTISTVFLGLDHSFGEGPPLLFETLVMGGKLDQEMDRCTTWDQAAAMHEAMSQRVLSSALLEE